MENNEKWYSIKVEAEVSLLPVNESGREKGITTGYRPNHNFGSEENTEMRVGQISVENDEWIEPGQTKKAIIDFLMPEGYIIDLAPGLGWRIQEGRKLVGNGRVIKLISSHALSN